MPSAVFMNLKSILVSNCFVSCLQDDDIDAHEKLYLEIRGCRLCTREGGEGVHQACGETRNEQAPGREAPKGANNATTV